jgi:creatinine amidohydrolase
VDVLVAPAIGYGLCRSTSDHPGTVSIGFETLKNLIVDVGLGLYKNGVRRLIVASGHAGQGQLAAMTEAGETLTDRCPGLVVAALTVVELLWDRVGDLVVTPGDGHAGELETSIVAHLRPEWVHGSSPAEKPDFPVPIIVRNKTYYWPGGVNGDPAAADPDKGAELIARGVDALVDLIGKVNDFEHPA